MGIDMKNLLLTMCLIWFIGCEEESDGCEVESSRCVVDDNEEIVQVCNADAIWEDALNCTSIDWSCCDVDGGVICLPENECSQ